MFNFYVPCTGVVYRFNRAPKLSAHNLLLSGAGNILPESHCFVKQKFKKFLHYFNRSISLMEKPLRRNAAAVFVAQ